MKRGCRRNFNSERCSRGRWKCDVAPRIAELFDPYLVNGQRVFMETSRHPKLDSDNIDALTEAIEIAVPPSCAMFTHECGGAASCVAVDAMSMGLLRDQLLVQILTTAPNWLDQLEEPRHRKWARTVQNLHRKALPGDHRNLPAPGDAEFGGAPS